MPEGILNERDKDVNTKTTCQISKPLEIPEINDLLENIHLLLQYIITQKQRKLKKHLSR